MTEITSPGDFPQVANLRTISEQNVSRPDGTISERPTEPASGVGNAGGRANFESPQADSESDDPLERTASRLQEIIGSDDASRNTRLRISLDEENGGFIYQSIDEETGEIVRQFPPEEIIDLLRSFGAPEGFVIDDSV